jgi:gas vesicle protein
MTHREYEYDEDFAEMHTANNMGGFLSGLLIGALAGAAAMLFFAPQAGEETRRKLRDKTMELRDTVGEKYDEVVETARERAQRLGEDVRSRVEDVSHRGQEMLEEQKNRVQDAVQAGRQSLKRR